jgi:hypothetical protein
MLPPLGETLLLVAKLGPGAVGEEVGVIPTVVDALIDGAVQRLILCD